MLRVGSAGQGEHAYLLGKAKDDLGRSRLAPLGDGANVRVVEDLAIRGEKRKSLVDDVMGPADFPDGMVPPRCRIATVLHDHGFDVGLLAQQLQLRGLDVTDPDHFGPACLIQLFERRPDLPIFFVESPASIGPVQDIGIDRVGVQVFERAFKRLCDLFGYGGDGVIGRSVVLTRDGRKFGLEKQLIPRDPFLRQGK